MNRAIAHAPLFCGVLASIILLDTPAIAQVTNSTSSAEGVSSDRKDAAPAAADADDIVVTARRVGESLQNVPVAIVAFSQNTLNERAISNSFDLAKSVPGLITNADSGNAALPSFAIRGRGQFFGAATGSVETYFADVPLSPPFQVPTLPAQFFDLASVQVLKGPQGTLFGRNTTGGAVLFVPQAPTDRFEAYVRGQLGTYSNRQLEAAINVPLAEGMALRVAGFYWQRNGYTRTSGGRIDSANSSNAGGSFFAPPQVFLPSIGVNNQDVRELRATLKLNPVDAFENTTIFTYHGDKNRGTTQLRKVRPGAPLGAAITAFFPNVLPNNPRIADVDTDLRRPRSSTYAVINTSILHVTDNLLLKNVASYINAKGYGNNPADVDGSPFPAVNLERPNRKLRNRQYVDELQLQGKFGSVDFIAGGILDMTRQPGSNQKINIVSDTYDTGGFDQQFRQSRFTSKGVFGSVTYHVTDQLTLNGAVRRTFDNIRERSVQLNNTPREVTVAVAPGAFPSCAVSPGTICASFLNGARKFRGWSYNGSAEYKLADDTLLYGGYRHGYKRGGFNGGPTVAQLNFGPEKVDDYYLGMKSSFDIGSRRATFNIEGFWDNYKGAQRAYLTLDGGVLTTVIQNVPKSRYRGFDADLTLNLTDWFRLAGNYTFVDAEFRRFPDPTVPAALGLAPFLLTPSGLAAFQARGLSAGNNRLAANPLGLVNRHKLNLQGRFHKDFADGTEIAFLPSMSYQSRFYFNDNTRVQPAIGELLFNGGLPVNSAADGASFARGYKLLDARLEFNHIADRLDISLNVTNLTNKTFVVGGSGIYQFGVDTVAYGAPRMWFVEARYRF